MTEENPFGHQREPVKITFNGHIEDVDFYIRKIKRAIESNMDIAERLELNTLMIYPAANND